MLTIIAGALAALLAFIVIAMLTGWQPVEEWCVIIRRSATSWVSLIIGGIVGLVGTHWAVLLGVLPFMPFWLQLPVALIVGGIVIAGPVIMARISDQPKLKAKIEEKKHGSA